MKVLHVNGGPISAGAARGAYWLHKALLSHGIDSTFVTQKLAPGYRDAIEYPATGLERLLYRVAPYLDRLIVRATGGGHTSGKFSTGLFGCQLQRLPEYKQADIVHLHWANRMLSVRQIGHLRKPIVWTLRDMWPFTGGCHYSGQCTRYETDCGTCPKLGGRFAHDASALIHQAKLHAWKGLNLSLVGISNWMRECAAKSSLFFGRPSLVIGNGVDTETFHPVPSAEARRRFGLPDGKGIVLFGAHNFFSNPDKGFHLLREAAQSLDHSPVCLVVFGSEVGRDQLGLPGTNVLSLGSISDDSELAALYSAADVFVAPSVQEGFGKMLVEAMACGTPVVAFDATGPADIVVHEQTGFLARPFDTGDLGRGIEWVLHDRDRRATLGAQARRRAVEQFSIDGISGRYAKLYQELVPPFSQPIETAAGRQ